MFLTVEPFLFQHQGWNPIAEQGYAGVMGLGYDAEDVHDDILWTAENFAQGFDHIAVNARLVESELTSGTVIGMELKRRSAAFSAGTASAGLKQMTCRSTSWTW